MAAPPRVLKVFLSSPGDVAEERALAERVLKRLGEEYRARVQLSVVLWEHEPLFAHAGFQEQIERPSQCDLVISLLWSRLGTRLPANFCLTPGETPPTGTEFEVQDALEGYRRLGRPHLLIYRRTAPPHVNLASADARERLTQFEMLQDFCRRAFYDEHGAVIVAHHDYAESWEFERKLSEHARKWLERTVGQSAVLPRWTAGSPYRGLQAFEAEHREIYFGRSHAQSELIELLRAVEERGGDRGSGTRFLLVQGMSGNGKSSLVRAGLLPLLEGRAVEGIGNWRTLIVKPSDRGTEAPGVFGALAERLLVALPRLQAGYTAATLAERLRAAPAESAARLDGYLTEEASRLRLKAGQIRLLLFVDQLEELWSSAVSVEERQALARCLAALAREGRTWMIATLRSDFAASLESVPELNGLLKEGRLYVLSAPQGDELGEMIREPAAAAGLEWESKEGLPLDQAIQREASASPESLPLLEYALDQLYERRAERRLTYAAYEELGRLSGGIAASAEAVLTEQGAAAAPALEKLLRCLVSVDESGQATRRYARLTEIPEGSPERALLERLIERRLCVTDNRGEGAEVSLAHEALLRTWPRLTDWLAQESGLLQVRELAQRETRLWLEHARSDAWLAAADKVVAFRALEAAAIPLRAEVRNFIDRSAQQVRRTSRIKQAAVTLIALLAVAASIGGWIALRKEREAQIQTAQARQAQLQMLTQIAADRLKAGDLALARGIILEVLRRVPPSVRPDPETVNVFQETRASDPVGAVLTGHTAYVHDVAYSPDGLRIVTASNDRTARIWDARTGVQLLVLTGHAKEVRSAVYSPDGTEILTGSLDGTARTWDARTGSLRRVLHHASLVACASYSPDGTKILTAGDRRYRIWDAASGAALAEFSAHRVGCARYSPDGTRIVMPSEEPGTARIWDAHTGAPLVVLSAPTSQVREAAYSPDGRQIVTTAGFNARTWDARTGAPLLELTGHQGDTPSAVWSPDGATIATTSLDKTVRLWDAKKGTLLRVLTGHTDTIGPAAFSPDGTHLVTGGSDLVARIWNVRGGPRGVVLSGHTDEIRDVAFSPDGLRVATASADKTARVWDSRTGAPLAVLSGHTDAVTQVAYSRDGSRIVTVSDDKTARVWDARTGAPLLTISAPADIMYASYSPDGGRIVAFFGDLTFGVWDARTGKTLAKSPGHNANLQGDRGCCASATYSPDGSRILTSSVDKTARVWDAKTLAPLAVLPHNDWVNTAFYSPDGTRIVTATNDRNAYVWDAATAVRIGVLSGHHSYLECAAFSPDGSRIVTSADDSTLRIWDAHSMTELAVLAVPGACAWSPDGTHLASVADDNTAHILDARIPADLRGQILWAQAAEPDPLSELQRTQLGVPPAISFLGDSKLESGAAASAAATRPSPCDLYAGAFYDPDRRAQGLDQASIDPELARTSCAREAASKGASARALYQAGRALRAGGQKKLARQYFERALAQDYRAAGIDLALLLSEPSGAMLDPHRAVSLLEQAWDQGLSIAGFELGALYEHGVAPADGAGHAWPADPAKASHWYQEAAKRDEPNSLARLAERSETDAVTRPGAAGDPQLLSAFTLYARAVARAEALGWPVSVWKAWRYRRSSLARVLAVDGKMQEAAEAYRSVLHDTQP
jgi:WD40 repeat protein/TPR repeat protein